MHSKKLFTWSDQKVHLSKVNQLGAFVTHHFLGRDLPSSNDLIQSIENNPNPFHILATEKLKQIQLSKEAKVKAQEQAEAEARDKQRQQEELNALRQGEKLTSSAAIRGKTPIGGDGVARKPGRPRRTRPLSPQSPSQPDMQHPSAKRTRRAEYVPANLYAHEFEEGKYHVLNSDEMRPIRSILVPTSGLGELMTMNRDLVTSLHSILAELHMVYKDALVHALQYFRHLLLKFLRRQVEDHKAFMEIMERIFCLHGNVDVKFQHHVEKYIFECGLHFEYYYLLYAVVCMVPCAVDTMDAWKIAAENFIAKVQQSCTEEQMKYVKHHLLNFSLKSDSMPPEVHILEISKLCSLLPPPLRSDFYAVFSLFRIVSFPNEWSEGFSENVIITKGSSSLFGYATGEGCQMVVNNVASLLKSFSQNATWKELLSLPQFIEVSNLIVPACLESTGDNLKKILLPEDLDKKIEKRIVEFYHLVEPYLKTLESLNNFVNLLNQASRLAFSPERNESSLKKAVKAVYDNVPVVLQTFVPWLHKKIWRIFTEGIDEIIEASHNDSANKIPSTSNNAAPSGPSNNEPTPVEGKHTTIDGLLLLEGRDSSTPQFSSMSDIMISVCNDLTSMVRNDHSSIVHPSSTMLDEALRTLNGSHSVEISSSTNMDMDLEFNPIPDSMEMGNHENATEGAKLLMESIPHDYFRMDNSSERVMSETECDLTIEDSRSSDLSPSMFAHCAPVDTVTPLFTLCTTGSSEKKDIPVRKELPIMKAGISEVEAMVSHGIPVLSQKISCGSDEASAAYESSNSPLNMVDIFTTTLLVPPESTLMAQSNTSSNGLILQPDKLFSSIEYQDIIANKPIETMMAQEDSMQEIQPQIATANVEPETVVISMNDGEELMKFRISKDKQLKKLFKKYSKTKGCHCESYYFTLKGVMLNPSTTVAEAGIVDDDVIQAIGRK